MVNEPVVTTLDTALPLSIPIRPEETTAAFAGPPRVPPNPPVAI
jgi:hypothetical protein